MYLDERKLGEAIAAGVEQGLTNDRPDAMNLTIIVNVFDVGGVHDGSGEGSVDFTVNVEGEAVVEAGV